MSYINHFYKTTGYLVQICLKYIPGCFIGKIGLAATLGKVKFCYLPSKVKLNN